MRHLILTISGNAAAKAGFPPCFDFAGHRQSRYDRIDASHGGSAGLRRDPQCSALAKDKENVRPVVAPQFVASAT
jgi:hypothetical protein